VTCLLAAALPAPAGGGFCVPSPAKLAPDLGSCWWGCGRALARPNTCRPCTTRVGLGGAPGVWPDRGPSACCPSLRRPSNERRYFRPRLTKPAACRGASRPALGDGLTICEDLLGGGGRAGATGFAGAIRFAELLPQRPRLLAEHFGLPLSWQGKSGLRRRLAAAVRRRGLGLSRWCTETRWVATDELVFDGASFVMDGPAVLAANALWPLPPWRCGRCQSQGRSPVGSRLRRRWPQTSPSRSKSTVFRVLAGGARLARKCGFERAPAGPQAAGIDSPLVAVIAAAALGGDHRGALLLPSPYSSEGLPAPMPPPWRSGSGIRHQIVGRLPA